MDFTKGQADETFFENIAVCDETLLEKYLNGEEISLGEIQTLIQNRQTFPCYFGSALKMEGIQEFLDGFDFYTKQPEYPEEFGAKVFKIGRDKQGARLTYLKVTGGTLKVKMLLKDNEKADQLRIYSGSGFTTVNEVHAGGICAVTGLTTTYSGEGLGNEKSFGIPDAGTCTDISDCSSGRV